MSVTPQAVFEEHIPKRISENPDVIDRIAEIIVDVRPHIMLTESPFTDCGRPMRYRSDHTETGIAAAEATEDRGGRSPLQVIQAVDCADWLPHDLLTKVDRCLMAHGVEGRTPLLDPAVAAVAYPLPDALKLRDGKGKWLLRRWLAARCPEAEAFAPKRGFTVPVADWIARQGARLGPLVANQPGIAEACRVDAVTALFQKPRGRRQGFAAWVLLFYALWHHRHVLGQAPEGDVFDVLSARR